MTREWCFIVFNICRVKSILRIPIMRVSESGDREPIIDSPVRTVPRTEDKQQMIYSFTAIQQVQSLRRASPKYEFDSENLIIKQVTW